MDFDAAEEQDGVRMSFNTLPPSRLESTRLVVPLGCTYTPLKENMPTVYYDPVVCKGTNCKTVLNPYCSIDFKSKMWVCTFCFYRNPLPPSYNDISETNLPAELIPRYTTMEYVTAKANDRNPLPPPIFLFVIDTCLTAEELEELKSAIVVTVSSLMPENSLVGLITYGKTVQLFELGVEEIPKSYVFNGSKDVTAKQISDLLSIGGRPAAQSMGNQTFPNRFLLPHTEVEFALTSILEELQVDPHPVKSGRRPLRATGAALSVAVGLLECSYPNCGARIMLFTGGPCTYGPGVVVSDDLTETLRSHTDISKDNAKHTKKAYKYYESLGGRAVTNGHLIDVFAQSYDQPGFYEMQELTKKTGGLVVLGDEFKARVFKDSFQKIFAKNEKGVHPFAFNATIDVQTSKEIKVSGCIGHCASTNKKTNNVSETEIGVGGTSGWKIGGIDPFTTLAFYFEVVVQHGQPLPAGQKGLIQFTTHYQSSSGERVLRVTTIARDWAPDTTNQTIGAGFDQEAAAVLMARIAVFKAETEEAFDVLRWLDRMLIRLVAKFADYTKDDPNSFQLSTNFAVYPQFMFHLRRSHFLQVWNSSPDETAFYRYMLNRENVMNTLLMIQPTLEAYGFGTGAVTVLLASTSIQPDKILLLDSFFRVVIHYGETIAQWRKAGYQDDPKHEAFKQLLEQPKEAAQELMKSRFPLPRFIEADQHTSQARFILATIDPVVTHTNQSNAAAGEVIFTDDVNLKVFMDHLKKLAVQSS
ncbi:protein transport protein sec23 [Planoprotostelium fungivorum]|uniref:Protein transport protein SEC23 n=1 Tax=Planoprotostelium fungivorum TaxID=1890364 RepID=A0A2P6NIH3_9EUKA|nr:protein transport protein sec23 [Planoprotostelium fungivorum]